MGRGASLPSITSRRLHWASNGPVCPSLLLMYPVPPTLSLESHCKHRLSMNALLHIVWSFIQKFLFKDQTNQCKIRFDTDRFYQQYRVEPACLQTLYHMRKEHPESSCPAHVFPTHIPEGSSCLLGSKKAGLDHFHLLWLDETVLGHYSCCMELMGSVCIRRTTRCERLG